MRAPILLSLGLLATAASAAMNDRQEPGIAGVRTGDATTYAARGFEAVALGTPATVVVHAGATWSVGATGPAAAIATMRVRVTQGRLVIDDPREGDELWNGRERSAAEIAQQRLVRFTITVPHLTDVSLGGSGRMSVDRLGGDHVRATVGGSGAVTVAQVTGEEATLTLGGSGHIAASGKVRALKVTVGGSGELDAPGLRARTANVTSAGSGQVRARVEGQATVSLVGSGHVDLGATARCSVTKMGSGSVRCGG